MPATKNPKAPRRKACGHQRCRKASSPGVLSPPSLRTTVHSSWILLLSVPMGWVGMGERLGDRTDVAINTQCRWAVNG
jgi:hypothetical protein